MFYSPLAFDVHGGRSLVFDSSLAKKFKRINSCSSYPLSLFFLLPNFKLKEHNILSELLSTYNFRLLKFRTPSFVPSFFFSNIIFFASTTSFTNFSNLLRDQSFVNSNRLFVLCIRISGNLCDFDFVNRQILQHFNLYNLQTILKLCQFSFSLNFLRFNANVSPIINLIKKKKNAYK